MSRPSTPFEKFLHHRKGDANGGSSTPHTGLSSACGPWKAQAGPPATPLTAPSSVGSTVSVDFSPQRRKFCSSRLTLPISTAATFHGSSPPDSAVPLHRPGFALGRYETGTSKLTTPMTVTSRAPQPREKPQRRQSGRRAAAAAALAAAAAATAAAAAAAVSANRRPKSAPVDSRLALISTAWSARPSMIAAVPEIAAYVPTGLESLAQAAVSLAIAVKSLASRSRTEDPLVEQSYKKLAAAADNLATSVQHSRSGSNREGAESTVTSPLSDMKKKTVTIKGARSVASSMSALIAPPATPMHVKAEGIQAWAAAAAVAAAAAATAASLSPVCVGGDSRHAYTHRQQLHSSSSASSGLMPFGAQDGSRPMTSRPLSASSGYRAGPSKFQGQNFHTQPQTYEPQQSGIGVKSRPATANQSVPSTSCGRSIPFNPNAEGLLSTRPTHDTYGALNAQQNSSEYQRLPQTFTVNYNCNRPTSASSYHSRPGSANSALHAFNGHHAPHPPATSRPQSGHARSNSTTSGTGTASTTHTAANSVTGTGTSNEAVQIMMRHPHKVRAMHRPLASPGLLTERDLQNDEVAALYNEALSNIKDKIYSKGLTAVTQMFRASDSEKSGFLDRNGFVRTIQAMNLGSALEDEQVLRMLVDAVDQDESNYINYNDFIAAMRFNQLPYKEYHNNIKHRVQGDPEQPIGMTAIRHPYGTLPDAEANNRACSSRRADKWADVREVFRDTDPYHTGEMGKEKFQEAMQALSFRHKLQLSEDEIHSVFREADLEYRGVVRYEDFLDAFTDCSKQHVTPEFLKPKGLRSSQMGVPWEWRGRKFFPSLAGIL